jgi:23S rRNA (guanine2445-N2)-methyltransferase / 23S rRNA (guanine2069-N7)-methyltransferase
VGRDEDLRDTRYSARVVKDGLVDRIRDDTGRRPSVNPDDPGVQIHVHLRDREVAFSIDMSGASLHRRTGGPGRARGVAPLKENLAAAVLRAAGWPALAAAGVPLLDPMCGTGTLLIEAASMALDKAPGLSRDQWRFANWHGHQPRIWRRVWDEAVARGAAAADRAVSIYGSDLDADALFAAKDNARRGGVEILLKQRDVADIEPPPGARDELPRGLVVCNPPYGVRVGDDEAQVRALHGTFGDVLRRRFLGWSAWILVGPGLVPALGLKTSRKIPLYNGPIECRLTHLEISTEPPKKPGPRREVRTAPDEGSASTPDLD